MPLSDYLSFLVNEIHTTVVATVDEEGLPVTAAIDMMDYDENGLYFLTARGKGFYRRLQQRPFLALTGMKGPDTMHCVALSLRGRVRELGGGLLPRLFEKNPYMNDIYPTAEARQALTVFQICNGSGEWFDLSQKPIQRRSFTFGGGQAPGGRYRITESCTGCRRCEVVCPQQCIDFSAMPAHIRQEHCLHCGNCKTICPQRAVIQEETS